jgi:hypothetical protein
MPKKKKPITAPAILHGQTSKLCRRGRGLFLGFFSSDEISASDFAFPGPDVWYMQRFFFDQIPNSNLS